MDWLILDKDDFPEALYEVNPVATLEERGVLSCHSDQLFQRAAGNLEQVVFVSHWTTKAPLTGGRHPDRVAGRAL
ncbi:hypothetical protein [Tropicibacter sp. Alg240-R139]|uniref:hypothetical protein n=1 Tax=Tropicibacter sp. Alg240-R139 TaxID=2305991 RepID=UPI0013DF1BB4|nr:hypothetical protein [Tropicibacter sp. Alg240-R139]